MAAPETDGAAAEGRIVISGQHVDIGDALRAHATEGLRQLAEKYFGGAEDMTATFTRGAKSNSFGCSVRVHSGRNLFFEGHSENARDAYLAFSDALEHVAKQLRRQKRAMREDKPVNAMKEGLL